MLRERYEITGVAGQGGMAVVYTATDKTTGQCVAIKQMGMFADTPEDLALAIAQFEHEAQLLHALSNDNIPRVYEWFEEHDDRFLVMDFIDGELLSKLSDIGKGEHKPEFLPEAATVANWAVQITRALHYLHSQKPRPIIYKDLKPDNLMLDRRGRVMLLDFGIAKGRDNQGQYKTIFKGLVTPGYAPPEQYSGIATDPRSDLYALGATLYALLSGRIPPQSVDRQSSLISRLGDPLVPLRKLNPSVSPAFEALVTHLMVLKRDFRVQNAELVLHALEALPERASTSDAAATAAPEGSRSTSPRRATIYALFLVMLVAAGCAWLLWWYL